jgi:hypothetical protein
MNAQIKALEEEREYLKQMIYKAGQLHLPFTVAVDNQMIPSIVTNNGREGLANCLSIYISIRLRNIENEIEKLKGADE